VVIGFSFLHSFARRERAIGVSTHHLETQDRGSVTLQRVGAIRRDALDFSKQVWRDLPAMLGVLASAGE
jgi:hypothetical protein